MFKVKKKKKEKTENLRSDTNLKIYFDNFIDLSVLDRFDR